MIDWVNKEGNAAVTAALSATVDDHTTTAGGLMELVLILARGHGCLERRHTEPHLLSHRADNSLVVTIPHLHMLVAAALAVTKWQGGPTGERPCAVKPQDAWIRDVRAGDHLRFPWPAALAEEANAARRLLLDRADLLAARDEVELRVGLAPEHLLDAALHRLSNPELRMSTDECLVVVV